MAAIKITKENFEEEVFKSEKKVLVDFWASWCGPCQALAPIIEELSNELTDVKICKVNIEEEMELAKKFMVMSIPTMLLFIGGKAVSSLVGVNSKENIIEMIRK